MNNKELVDYIAEHITNEREIVGDTQILWDIAVALYRYGYTLDDGSPL